MLRRALLAATLLTAPLTATQVLAQAADGTLRMGMGAASPGPMDPYKATTQDKGIMAWVHDGLVRFPPGSADPAKLEPDLAESFTVSPDGKTFTFKLRPNVTFSDGTAFTAADVIASYKRAGDPKASSFAGDRTAIASVESPDPMTVVVTLKEPTPGALGLFANYHGGLIASAKSIEAGGTLSGTGPYRITAVDNATVKLAAFNENFRGKPSIPAIEVRYINADSTRELAYLSGELDIIYGRREQRWVERMRAQPKTTVDVFDPGEFRTLLINTKSGPLTDPRVRRAVQYAIDAKAISRFVGADVAPASPSPVPPGYLGYTADVPNYGGDVAKAKALLAEAGFPNGLTLKSTVSSVTSQQPIMEVIQSQLRRAGITLEMDVVEHPVYHVRIRQDLSQLTFYGAARYPVADSYLTQFYHSRSAPGLPTASLNFAHCNAADSEIDEARTETDQAKQIALWQTAQRKIIEAGCSVPLFDLKQVFVRKASLQYDYKLEGALNLIPPITVGTKFN